MTHSSYAAGYRSNAFAGRGTAPAYRESYLIAAWWVLVACTGLVVMVFARDILPPKASSDGAIIREYMDSRNLWEGLSFDGWVNTARVWWLLYHVLPDALVMPVYYCLLVAVATRVLGVYQVHLVRYQALAGAWIVCSAFFLWGVSKEIVALPVALGFCLAGGRGARLLATIVLLSYAAFFRPYWAICFFYFEVVSIALRMHIANRPRLAAFVLLLGFVLPFVAANALDFGALTEARNEVNIDRIDNPDRRSAFDNTFENTGFATDVANAMIAWFHTNVPVALLLERTPHYFAFAVFQVCSLWFFAAGCKSFLRDARIMQRPGLIHLRCVAFVIAFSMTQAIFEPDFGSFLRHEIVIMIPMLIVVFYRAHVSAEMGTSAWAGARKEYR